VRSELWGLACHHVAVEVQPPLHTNYTRDVRQTNRYRCVPRATMRFTLTICGIVWLCGSPALAQRTIDLTGRPPATVAQPFTMVTGVRELPGNAAIVTDQFERRVFLVDFGSGTARQIGRQGDGPGEYRFPMAPLPAPGNATWIFDATLRRVHVVSADGAFSTTLAPPVSGVLGRILAARGSDRMGRLYFESNSFDRESGRFLDSITIVRWGPMRTVRRSSAKSGAAAASSPTGRRVARALHVPRCRSALGCLGRPSGRTRCGRRARAVPNSSPGRRGNCCIDRDVLTGG